MRTIELLYIQRNNLENIQTGNIRIPLWRANRTDEDAQNPLYPLLKPRELPGGRVRPPDVRIKDTKKGTYVKSQIGVGTSLMDKPGGFGNKNWEYLLLPIGTAIPVELVITKDHWMEKQQCYHYSLSPNFTMPLDFFLRALDILAFNAKIELQRKAK